MGAAPRGYCPVWWLAETDQAPCTVEGLVPTVEEALAWGWLLSRLCRWPYTGFVIAWPPHAVAAPLDLPDGSGRVWLVDPTLLPAYRVAGHWPPPPGAAPPPAPR